PQRLALMVEGLGTMPGVRLAPPQGAFYVFPDVSGFFGRRGPDGAIGSATDLSMYLLRHAGVASVPGEGFGAPAHVRFSYAAARPLAGVPGPGRGLLGPGRRPLVLVRAPSANHRHEHQACYTDTDRP